MITAEDIKCCILKGVQKKDDYNIIIKGSMDYGEGFVCDVKYATIINKKTNEETQLVVKYLKDDVPWKGTPVMTMFHREVFIYTKVYPIFSRLQSEHCEKPIFRGLAKCYGCSIEDGKEMIILENLKPCGYNIRPRTKPYSIEDSKLVLTELAKWHAFSFALKDQKSKVFEELSEYKLNIFGQLCINSNLYKLFYDQFVNSIKELEGYVDDNVLGVYRELKELFSDLMLGHIKEDNKYMVISHGDAWSNNFLFKYTDNDTINQAATDVCIIDWQCSSFSLPVYDVSHFIYTSSNIQQLNRMHELLDAYYNSLSNTIRELGSDPDTLYPREVFREQYQKYRGRGLIMTPLFLSFLLADDADKPLDSGKVSSLKEMFRNFTPSNRDEYRRRLIEFVEHYANFQF